MTKMMKLKTTQMRETAVRSLCAQFLPQILLSWLLLDVYASSLLTYNNKWPQSAAAAAVCVCVCVCVLQIKQTSNPLEHITINPHPDARIRKSILRTQALE
jgi:hypothetical protein